MQKIGVVVRHSFPENFSDFFRQFLVFLKAQNKEIFLGISAQNAKENFSITGEFSVLENAADVDLIIFIGGDGTLLRLLQTFAPQNFSVPVFGINAGNVGFFSSTSPENACRILEEIFAGNSKKDERMMLSVSLQNEKNEIQEFFSLNECVIHHSGIARLREISAKISGENLTTYRADGLIIATPTGSTAYNAAAGGPIVSPDQSAFVVTPIAPAGFAHQPIVISSQNPLCFSADEEMVISVDGQEFFPFEKGSVLHISKAKNSLVFVRHPSEDFYESLREKLGWGK